jgi:hypothetical protein
MKAARLIAAGFAGLMFATQAVQGAALPIVALMPSAVLSQPEKKAEPGVAPATTIPAKDAKEAKDDRATDGKTKAAVITFGDEENGHMVGIFATADSFRQTIKMLKDEKVDVVVVRFKSGGGALLEIQKLSDVFHFDFKKDFRLVAWIDSAISAAAMSAHCFEEIYFTPQANYGACTGFSGRLNAMKGPGLERVLMDMEKISVRGGYDPKIMRAMQISAIAEESEELKISPPWGALSANVNEDTGEVTFYQDATSGSIVLNPKGGVHVLTFNALEAEKVKFSKGTAANLEELGKAMGLTEVEWVGKPDKRFIWPVSKAEQFMIDFRKKTKIDQENFNRYMNNLNNFLNLANGANEADRGKLVGQARQWLNQIKAMVKNNPNWTIFNFGGEEEYQAWVEQVEKAIKQLSQRNR